MPRFSVLLATLLVAAPPVLAQSAEGMGPTAFGTALQLSRAATTFERVNYYPATYQFTVRIPERAERSLARLTIAFPAQYGRSFARLPDPNDVRVFFPDDPAARRPQSPEQILPAQVSLAGQVLVIDFPEPVPAGQTVTVECNLMRNPRLGGTYLFDVNAWPAGPRPIQQFVGYGRIVFRTYDRFF